MAMPYQAAGGPLGDRRGEFDQPGPLLRPGGLLARLP